MRARPCDADRRAGRSRRGRCTRRTACGFARRAPKTTCATRLGECAANARSANELVPDRAEDEGGERVREQSAVDEPAPSASRTTATTPAMAVEPEQAQLLRPSAAKRHNAISGAIPISSNSRRPNAKEEVVVRPRNHRRLAANRLGEDQPEDAQDRQAERDQQQVVVEKRRLARHERFERVRERSEQRTRTRAADDGATKMVEAEEPRTDRALGERVDRVEDP